MIHLPPSSVSSLNTQVQSNSLLAHAYKTAWNSSSGQVSNTSFCVCSSHCFQVRHPHSKFKKHKHGHCCSFHFPSFCSVTFLASTPHSLCISKCSHYLYQIQISLHKLSFFFFSSRYTKPKKNYLERETQYNQVKDFTWYII